MARESLHHNKIVVRWRARNGKGGRGKKRDDNLGRRKEEMGDYYMISTYTHIYIDPISRG